jgi:hypothetical protein
MDTASLDDTTALKKIVDKIEKEFSVESLPHFYTHVTIKEVSNGFVIDIEESVPKIGAMRRVTSIDSTIEGVEQRIIEYFNKRKTHANPEEAVSDCHDKSDLVGGYH